MNILQSIQKELNAAANKSDSERAQGFFKTGKGEYGEGDIFIGVRVPLIKKIAIAHYKDTSLENVKELLLSGIHEERNCSLAILTLKYRAAKTDDAAKKKIFYFYVRNSSRINNWDLVDMSAPIIPGDYLFDRDRAILETFARSENLWKKRISIIATHGFIKRGDFDYSFRIADILLADRHDLMHKAVGWTLREIGKKNAEALEKYLKARYREMPRTMLRYAIEKFSESKREKYLKGRI